MQELNEEGVTVEVGDGSAHSEILTKEFAEANPGATFEAAITTNAICGADCAEAIDSLPRSSPGEQVAPGGRGFVGDKTLSAEEVAGMREQYGGGRSIETIAEWYAFDGGEGDLAAEGELEP